MKNFVGGEMETGPEVSRKKHCRARKPKFEVSKPKLGNDKKKKDKKVTQTATTEMAKLGLEAFPVIFAEIRESNRRLKDLNSEIDGYVLAKLAAWDAEDELRYLTYQTAGLAMVNFSIYLSIQNLIGVFGIET